MAVEIVANLQVPRISATEGEFLWQLKQIVNHVADSVAAHLQQTKVPLYIGALAVC